MRGGSFNGAEIVSGEFDVEGSEIFFQALQSGSSGNRNNPGLLGKQPTKRNLRARCVLTFSDATQSLNEPLIRWCREHVAALEVADGGKGLHYVQEDAPDTIARLVAEWRRRVLS